MFFMSNVYVLNHKKNSFVHRMFSGGMCVFKRENYAVLAVFSGTTIKVLFKEYKALAYD